MSEDRKFSIRILSGMFCQGLALLGRAAGGGGGSWLTLLAGALAAYAAGYWIAKVVQEWKRGA